MNGKASLFFQASNFGWSENYYRVSTSREDLLTAVGKVLISRSQMLGDGADLVYIRVSDIDVFRDVEIARTEGAGMKHSGIGPSDSPWNGILVRCFAGDQSWRNQIFRGVPDATITFPWDPGAHADWINALTAFTSKLQAQAFGNLTIAQGGLNAPQPINGIVANPAGGLDLSMPVGFAPVPGETVKITGNKALTNKLHGPYQVFSINLATGTMNIRSKSGPVLPGGLIAFGFAQRQTKTILPFSSFVPINPSKRKTGRPFGSPVGRSKVRK